MLSPSFESFSTDEFRIGPANWDPRTEKQLKMSTEIFLNCAVTTVCEICAVTSHTVTDDCL